jgi:hypothetical protein
LGAIWYHPPSAGPGAWQVDIVTNLALRLNYAIMLSTSQAAGDKKSRFSVCPPGERAMKRSSPSQTNLPNNLGLNR